MNEHFGKLIRCIRMDSGCESIKTSMNENLYGGELSRSYNCKTISIITK